MEAGNRNGPEISEGGLDTEAKEGWKPRVDGQCLCLAMGLRGGTKAGHRFRTNGGGRWGGACW